jgi:HTH-type transcriptional regulator/antitoxin HigA
MNSSQTYIAIPPGETIKEQLSFRSMSQKEFAVRMGLSEKHVTNLLKGRVQLTSNVAMRLESVLGAPAVFWENLEALYREALIKVEEENQIATDAEIAKKLPYTEMVKYGWIHPSKTAYEKVSTLRKFFEVSTLRLIDNPAVSRIACRRLSSGDFSDYALITWAQKAKLDARNVDTKPININGLANSVPIIRALSTVTAEVFCPKLTKLFSDNGIALIFLPHLKDSAIQGASFYDGKKIVVGVTVHKRYTDTFWFSLFHEVAHIIYGHIGQTNGTSEVDEKDADDFARETLIPSEMLKSFVQAGIFTSDTLTQFAEQLGIEVGILVGRLQHDGVIKCNRFNNLKSQYDLGEKDND